MGRNFYYFLFLLWLCYLIVTSVLLFTRGFLLSRVVQDKNATCEPISEIQCTSSETISTDIDGECSREDRISNLLKDYETVPNICLPPKAKVVLLIVDALRYDFTLFDEKNANPLPFQNKLPVINRLVRSSPEHTRLYKFIADPPTTTMQRVKGLTTGSLPTFIDAGSNFATSEINEDNIIDQLIRNEYNVIFMGDDTWNGLYPNRFTRNYPYPSFNVWDLDTVDNGVRDHLYEELNNTDWRLLIGHFLGVDHCGHRYGPNHPEMERKLGEINTVIENVIEQMDETTMLFVIGDHGMTSTGDHGGESEDEVTAGFFLYSKQPLVNKSDEKDSVKQVDIVPTLASILGISIPFQNLGILMPDCLPINESFGIENWRLVLYHLWTNVNQVLNYIREYSKTTDTFPEETLSGFYRKFSKLKAKLPLVEDEESFRQITGSFVDYISDLRKMCEEVWIQFDSYAMTRGLLFLFTSIFFAFIITDGIPTARIAEIFSGSFVKCSYGAVFASAAFSAALYYSELVENLQNSVFLGTAIASQVMLVLLVVQNWETISLNWYDKSGTDQIPNLVSRIVLVFNVCGLFSNSYIIEESFVLQFLLVTVILVGTIGVLSDGKRKITATSVLKRTKLKLLLLAILVAVLVRVSAYFWRCREEQQWCFSNPHEATNVTAKTETTKLRWGVAVIFLAVFVFATKEWLRGGGNLNGYAATVTFAKFVPTIAVVCVAGYWVMKRVPSRQNQSDSVKSADLLAWTVYGLTSLGVAVTVIKPLCTYLRARTGAGDGGSSVPFLFKKLKDIMTEKEKTEEDEVPVIHGLGTAYSAVYVIVGVYVTLFFGLLLGDAVAPSAVIMFMTTAFVLIIMSVIRIEKANSIEQLFNIPNISILVWIILAQYFFYASGHQPTFPNIAWEAAFIGTSGTFTNNIIPGALIITNTFCSYILTGLLLPLLLIAPFTVFVMIPSLVGKKSTDFQIATYKGEVVLFERDHLTVTSAFVLSCKYVIGHAIRVFASMLAATIHCRHLMVWKIFAPKFIFESIAMFVTLASVMIGYLIFIRVHKKVENLIVKLNKLK